MAIIICFSGCGAVRLAHHFRVVGAAGSNPVIPTKLESIYTKNLLITRLTGFYVFRGNKKTIISKGHVNNSVNKLIFKSVDRIVKIPRDRLNKWIFT